MSNTTVLERLNYVLGLDTSELKKGIRQSEQLFNSLMGSVTRFAAGVGVAFSFKNIISGIHQLYDEFDHAMRQVWTLLDITESEFRKLENQVISLSKHAPYSAKELADGLYEIVSAGVEAENAMTFLEKSMTAAMAGASDLFTATDGLTTIMNSWQLKMEDLDHVMDVVFNTIKYGKTYFNELASYIGTVAPAAALAGVSLETLMSAAATLTKTGLKTRRAMTGLNYAIQSVIKPTAKAKNIAKELGISFDVATLKSLGFAKFLEYVGAAADYDQEALANLFGSVEASRTVFALLGAGNEEFHRILAQTEDVSGFIKIFQNHYDFEMFDDLKQGAADAKEDVDELADSSETLSSSLSEAQRAFLSINNLTLDIDSLKSNLSDIAEESGLTNTAVSDMVDTLGKIGSSLNLPAETIIQQLLLSDEDVKKLDYTPVHDALNLALEGSNTDIESFKDNLLTLNSNPAFDFGRLTTAVDLVISNSESRIASFRSQFESINNITYDFSSINEAVQAVANSEGLTTPVSSIVSYLTAINDVGEGWTFPKITAAISTLVETTGTQTSTITTELRKIADSPADADLPKYEWLVKPLDDVATQFGVSRQTLIDLLLEIDDSTGSLDFGGIATQLSAVKPETEKAMEEIRGKIEEVGKINVSFSTITSTLAGIKTDTGIEATISDVKSMIESLNNAKISDEADGSFPLVIEALSALKTATGTTVQEILSEFEKVDTSSYEFSGLKESYRSVLGDMGMTNLQILKLIESVKGYDDSVEFTELLSRFTEIKNETDVTAQDIQSFVQAVYQTAEQLGMSDSEAMAKVNAMLNETKNSNREASKAYDKTKTSIENLKKQAQRSFEAVYLSIGRFIEPLTVSVTEFSAAVGSWASEMNAAEGIGVTLGGALMASGVIGAGFKSILGIVTSLAGTFGVWSLGIAAVGAAIAGATILIGTFAERSNTTNKVLKETEKLLEQISDVDLFKAVQAADETTKAFQEMKETVDEISDAEELLIAKVEAYNAVQGDSVDEAKNIKDEINLILENYPQLADMVSITNDGLSIQYEIMGKINDQMQAQLLNSKMQSDAQIVALAEEMNRYDALQDKVTLLKDSVDSLSGKSMYTYGVFNFREEIMALLKQNESVKADINSLFASGITGVNSITDAEKYYFENNLKRTGQNKGFEEEIEQAAKNTINIIRNELKPKLDEALHDLYSVSPELVTAVQRGDDRTIQDMLYKSFDTTVFDYLKDYSDNMGISMNDMYNWLTKYSEISFKLEEIDNGTDKSYYDVLNSLIGFDRDWSGGFDFQSLTEDSRVKDIVQASENLRKANDELLNESVNWQYSMETLKLKITSSYSQHQNLLETYAENEVREYVEFMKSDPTAEALDAFVKKRTEIYQKTLGSYMQGQDNFYNQIFRNAEFLSLNDSLDIKRVLDAKEAEIAKIENQIVDLYSSDKITGLAEEWLASLDKIADSTTENQKFDSFIKRLDVLDEKASTLRKTLKLFEDDASFLSNGDFLSREMPSLISSWGDLNHELTVLKANYSDVFTGTNLTEASSRLDALSMDVKNTSAELDGYQKSIEAVIRKKLEGFEQQRLALQANIENAGDADSLRRYYSELYNLEYLMKRFSDNNWFDFIDESESKLALREWFSFDSSQLQKLKSDFGDYLAVLQEEGKVDIDLSVNDISLNAVLEQSQQVMQDVSEVFQSEISDNLSTGFKDLNQEIQDILENLDIFKLEVPVSVVPEEGADAAVVNSIEEFNAQMAKKWEGKDLQLNAFAYEGGSGVDTNGAIVFSKRFEQLIAAEKDYFDVQRNLLADENVDIDTRLDVLKSYSMKLRDMSDTALESGNTPAAADMKAYAEYYESLASFLGNRNELSSTNEKLGEIFDQHNTKVQELNASRDAGNLSAREYQKEYENAQTILKQGVAEQNLVMKNAESSIKSLIDSTKIMEEKGLDTFVSLIELREDLADLQNTSSMSDEEIAQYNKMSEVLVLLAEHQKQVALAGQDEIAVFELKKQLLNDLQSYNYDFIVDGFSFGITTVSDLIDEVVFSLTGMEESVIRLKKELAQQEEIERLTESLDSLNEQKETMERLGISGKRYEDVLTDISELLDELVFKGQLFELGDPEQLALWKGELDEILAKIEAQNKMSFEEGIQHDENILSYYEKGNIDLERQRSLHQGLISQYEQEIEAKVKSLSYDQDAVAELERKKALQEDELAAIEKRIEQEETSVDSAQDKIDALEESLRKNREEQDAVEQLNLGTDMQNQLLREELSILEEIVILAQMAGLDLNIDEQLAKIKELRSSLDSTKKASRTWQDSITEQERLLSFYQNAPESEEKANKIKGIYQSMANIVESQIEDLVKAGDANSDMIPVLQEKLALYNQELGAIEQAADAQDKAQQEQKEALQAQADQYNALIGAVGNGFANFGETGRLISNILGEMKFKVEELEDGTSRLVSPFEDMEGLMQKIGTQIAVFGIEQIMSLAANLLYTFQEVKRIQEDLNKWEYDENDLNTMIQNFRDFESNKQKLAGKMMDLPFAQFLDAITFGLFGFSQGIESEIDELKQKLDITFNDIASNLGVGIEDILSSLEDAFSEDTYEGFLRNFTTSLEQMTRQALIKAFLAQAVQPIIEEYVKMFVDMVDKGNLTPESAMEWKEQLEDAIEGSGMESFFDIIKSMFEEMEGYGDEYGGSDSISRSITEDTGNRLAALLTTINMHVGSIDHMLNYGTLKVQVTNISQIGGINANDYMAALGLV